MEQHRALEERLQALLVAPRPEFLATSDERRLSLRLRALEARVAQAGEHADPALHARLERLRGIVTWSLKTQYHERLTEFYGHLEESRQAVDELNEQYNAFVRVRQAATHSFVGYEPPIQRLRTRVAEAAGRIDQLMARQGRMLETVAIRELESRVQRLEGYQDQARYALADSYDRATKAQSALEGGE